MLPWHVPPAMRTMAFALVVLIVTEKDIAVVPPYAGNVLFGSKGELLFAPARVTRSEEHTLNSSHTEIYTLSLHDALPICSADCDGKRYSGCPAICRQCTIWVERRAVICTCEGNYGNINISSSWHIHRYAVCACTGCNGICNKYPVA